MSVNCKIDSEKIEILFENNFSLSEMITAVQEALDQAKKPLPILINASNSTDMKSEVEIREFSKFLNRNKSRFIPRIAILVVQEVRYGTARQIGAFFEMGGIESEPFYSRDDAIVWLLSYNKS